MRRRSWAWAAEQRPATAAKARRWPRRRPRSRRARGSMGICAAFIDTPGHGGDRFVPIVRISLFILKELIGRKRKKRDKFVPLSCFRHVRGSPPLIPWYDRTERKIGGGGRGVWR